LKGLVNVFYRWQVFISEQGNRAWIVPWPRQSVTGQRCLRGKWKRVTSFLLVTLLY